MYDESALTPLDPTDLTWAIAWARCFLRDRVTPFVYTDTELAAALTAHAFLSGGDTYYRPHVTVANLITTDPDRATSESLLGASITTRSPASIALGVRVSGRWVDDVIQNEAGERPPSGRTLRGAAF